MSDVPIAFEAWQKLAQAYSDQVESKPHNALYERPATLSLLQEVRGKRILDAGCGPGVYAQLLMNEGAVVVGFDRSPNMVALARERLSGKASIHEADLREPLTFAGDGSFDAVLSSLALDYTPDWRPVFQEFYRVLRPGGVFVYSAGHPFHDFYTFIERATYFKIEAIEQTWRGFGFAIDVPFYRRPLAEMINPLIAAGFLLDQILEPVPLDEFQQHEPEDYQKLIKEPGFICIRAVKPAAGPGDVAQSAWAGTGAGKG